MSNPPRQPWALFPLRVAGPYRARAREACRILLAVVARLSVGRGRVSLGAASVGPATSDKSNFLVNAALTRCEFPCRRGPSLHRNRAPHHRTSAFADRSFGCATGGWRARVGGSDAVRPRHLHILDDAVAKATAEEHRDSSLLFWAAETRIAHDLVEVVDERRRHHEFVCVIDGLSDSPQNIGARTRLWEPR